MSLERCALHELCYADAASVNQDTHSASSRTPKCQTAATYGAYGDSRWFLECIRSCTDVSQKENTAQGLTYFAGGVGSAKLMGCWLL
jgi:hypothetical protein